jgi:hypothetical protein
MTRAAVLVLIVLTGGTAQARGKQPRGLPRLPRLAPSGCSEAYRVGQEQIDANHLIDASHSLAVCARPACGAFLARHCKLRRAQVELDIPTVVPLATDGAGQSLVDVTVTVDGLPLMTRLDGRAASVDPGMHEFAFIKANGPSTKQQLVIVQGQRNRQISVALGEKPKDIPDVFETAAPLPGVPTPAPSPALFSEDPRPAAAPPSRGFGFGPYLLTGLGVAGLGGYALLTHWGRQDNDALDNCRPSCRPETMHHIRMLYLGADISAGVGAAALVGATTWFILRARSSNRERVAVHVVPTTTGGLAVVSGAF